MYFFDAFLNESINFKSKEGWKLRKRRYNWEAKAFNSVIAEVDENDKDGNVLTKTRVIPVLLKKDEKYRSGLCIQKVRPDNQPYSYYEYLVNGNKYRRIKSDFKNKFDTATSRGNTIRLIDEFINGYK